MADSSGATESFYACLHLSETGTCSAWQRIPIPSTEAIDFNLLNQNFLYGFAAIFGLWSIGFTISVVVKLIRLA